MSSCNRRSFLILPLALAACGFTPAYGPKGPAQRLQGAVYANDPSDKNSFDFVAAIEARFGRAQDAAYGLAYTIRTEAVGAGYTTSNTITRYNLKGSIDWTLIDLATETRLAGGTAENFTSWSATGSTVAGLSAKEAAAERLMTVLADQIAAQILAASARFAQ